MMEKPPQIDRKKEREDLSPLKPGLVGEKIAGGVFSKVYDVNKVREDFPSLVVKIGETSEFRLPLSNKLNLKISRKKADSLLKIIMGKDFDIIPNKESIMKGVAEYGLMKEYFGPEDPRVREEILKDLADRESSFHRELAGISRDENFFKKLTEIFEKYKDIDFLPKEQTVIGHPADLDREEAERLLADGKPLPATFYIFQQKIEGANVLPLFEIDEREIAERPELAEKLLMFSILIKKLYHATGNLLDTRPEEALKYPFEWFEKTANILVDKGINPGDEKIYFVDTRLLWNDKQKYIGKEGFNLIERLGVKSIDRAIKKYAALSNGK